jgi:parallel beta-helix repeat protein
MKKIITLGIFVIISLSCFFSIVVGYSLKSWNHVSGVIIIVDDEGDGDFIRIKDALTHADPGDIIEVYSGTYNEYKIDIIEERITLQGIAYEYGNGYDTGKPFINGKGKNYVFFFDAENITLDNFHIENKDGTSHDIIDLSHNANGCVISNNDLSNTDICFIYVKGSNNKIINNNISNSLVDDGICLRDPSSNCIVSGNVISNVETGILCWDSNYNTITGNKISRCSRFGLDLASSDYNIVDGNTFENNVVGLDNYYSIGCRIDNNNFINNQIQAQFVYGMPIFSGYTNRWNGNFWNRSRLLPYPIWGGFIFLPLVQFDWYPSKKPYSI